MKLVKVAPNIYEWQGDPIPEKGSKFIALVDLADHGKVFWDKVCEIQFTDEYNQFSKNYVAKILEFLEDWEYISRKQYLSVMNMLTREQISALYKSKRSELAQKYGRRWAEKASIVLSDYDRDNLSEKLFGPISFAEEEEGYVRAYRRNGSRYWALPTENKDLCEYLGDQGRDRLFGYY